MFFDMRTIEKVHESSYDGHDYRFSESEKGVSVRRVPSNNPLWSHGLVSEVYDLDEKKFRESAIAGQNLMFKSLIQADDTISGLVINAIKSKRLSKPQA